MDETMERLQAPWANKDRKQGGRVLLLWVVWNAHTCGCGLKAGLFDTTTFQLKDHVVVGKISQALSFHNG